MRSRGVFACIAAVAMPILIGCGGGGGSSSPTGSFVQPTAGPPTTPSSPPTSPSSAPTASSLSFSARVVDGDHGNAAVSGAAVTVGTALSYVGSAYVVAGSKTTATTAADGSFTVSAMRNQVFMEVDAPGLVSLHRPLPATSGGLGTLTLPTATSEDLSGLAELNKDRAQLGTGAGAVPLTLDADLELLARYRVNDMATKGYYGHTAPGQSRAASVVYLCSIDTGAFCASPTATPIYNQENLDADASSQADAEDAYVEAGSTDGHYQNVISTRNLWVGFGEALNGRPAPGFGGATASYFAEEFFTTSPNPLP